MAKIMWLTPAESCKTAPLWDEKAYFVAKYLIFWAIFPVIMKFQPSAKGWRRGVLGGDGWRAKEKLEFLACAEVFYKVFSLSLRRSRRAKIKE